MYLSYEVMYLITIKVIWLIGEYIIRYKSLLYSRGSKTYTFAGGVLMQIIYNL